ncbi:hypothetical protein Hanom_Chr03g00181971 [Helianthus anomalus]
MLKDRGTHQHHIDRLWQSHKPRKSLGTLKSKFNFLSTNIHKNHIYLIKIQKIVEMSVIPVPIPKVSVPKIAKIGYRYQYRNCSVRNWTA